MTFVFLSTDLVVAIHDAVLNPGELRGLALDKSLDGALARVDNRIAYGMIEDVFELATAYAEAISQGDCFNDANKRTAYEAMAVCLEQNGVVLTFVPGDAGPRIIDLAQGRIAAEDMAVWLRRVAEDQG